MSHGLHSQGTVRQEILEVNFEEINVITEFHGHQAITEKQFYLRKFIAIQ